MKSSQKPSCVSGNTPKEVELEVPGTETKSKEELTLEQKNEVMVQALNDIFNIYMTFDFPKPENFGMIAQRTLKKVGKF